MDSQSIIQALIEELHRQRIELSWDDLADAFWLAVHLPARPRKEEPARIGPPPTREEAKPVEKTPSEPVVSKRSETDLGRKAAEKRGEESTSRAEEKFGQVYPQPLPGTTGVASAGGVLLRTPAAPALPHALAMARAMRPLMRRMASRTMQVLDEAATVERIAEERIWVTVSRPARERWFEVALVVDAAVSMAVWKPTIDEFRLLLERQGAFRDVRVWRLDTHAPGPLSLSAGPGRPNHAPAELNDAVGRRLILVATDGVTDGWRDGRVKDLLEGWARRGPVAVVQMLSRTFWEQTALAASSVITVRAAGAGLPSALLEVVDRRRRARPAGAARPIPIPVFTLEPAVTGEWAHLVAGAGTDPTATALLMERWDPESDRDPDAEPRSDSPGDAPADLERMASRRIADFESMASLRSRRLARLFAAMPVLRLPVLRVVQAALMPDTGQTELAEVVLGGLLRAVNPAADPDLLEFEFHPGVRDKLLDRTYITDAIAAFTEASRYIASHLGHFRDFSAIIADPTRLGDAPIEERDKPFAQVASRLLRRLGGVHAALADRLEEEWLTMDDIEKIYRDYLSSIGLTVIGERVDRLTHESQEFLRPNDTLENSFKHIYEIKEQLSKSPLDQEEINRRLKFYDVYARIPAYVQLQLRPREGCLEGLLDCLCLEMFLARKSRETRPMWQLLEALHPLVGAGEDLAPDRRKYARFVVRQGLDFLEANAHLDLGGQCKESMRSLLQKF